jgi:hypothetical protein
MPSELHIERVPPLAQRSTIAAPAATPLKSASVVPTAPAPSENGRRPIAVLPVDVAELKTAGKICQYGLEMNR